MRELLSIMANLMRNDRRGPAEVGYRALLKLAEALPEQAFDLLTRGERRTGRRLTVGFDW
jgi:hypothetical protein